MRSLPPLESVDFLQGLSWWLAMAGDAWNMSIGGSHFNLQLKLQHLVYSDPRWPWCAQLHLELLSPSFSAGSTAHIFGRRSIKPQSASQSNCHVTLFTQLAEQFASVMPFCQSCFEWTLANLFDLFKWAIYYFPQAIQAYIFMFDTAKSRKPGRATAEKTTFLVPTSQMSLGDGTTRSLSQAERSTREGQYQSDHFFRVDATLSWSW